MQCRIFNSMVGLCALNAIRMLSPNCDNQTCFQTLQGGGGAKSLPVENHCLQGMQTAFNVLLNTDIGGYGWVCVQKKWCHLRSSIMQSKARWFVGSSLISFYDKFKVPFSSFFAPNFMVNEEAF